jgi:hypothetical protein
MKPILNNQSFTRPADTTAYAAGDLIANSTTAGSVTPLTFRFDEGIGPLFLRSVTLRKSQASSANANFRLWFMNASPTLTNGDNGAIAGAFLSTVLFEPILLDTTTVLTSGGAIGTSMFDDGMLPLTAPVYVLIEAMAAYSPANAETFSVDVVARS